MEYIADVLAAIPAGEIAEPEIEDEDDNTTDELLRQLGATTFDDHSSDSDYSSDWLKHLSFCCFIVLLFIDSYVAN